MSLRVAVADDSLLVREGLEQLLSLQPEIELVGSCGDLQSLFELVERERPDVVLTDIRMPPSKRDEGIQAATRLRTTDPEVGVVVLSQYSDPSYALALLESGSDGRAYLLKERVNEGGQLVAAIKTVANGGSVVDPKVVEALVAGKRQREHSPLNQLTPRELEVLALVAEGQSNAAIADSLVLTKRAVEKHINSIFAKLNFPSRGSLSKRVKATLLFLSETGPPPGR